jgi:hypothetical protein
VLAIGLAAVAGVALLALLAGARFTTGALLQELGYRRLP